MAKTRYVIEAQDKITPELRKIQKEMKSFGDSFKNVGKAMAGFFAVDAIKDFGSQAVAAFAEKEKSLLRFDAVLKNIGADKSIQEYFKGLSDQLEGLGTGIDDANVLDLASQFLALGRTAPEVEKLLRVGADLSALTGNDLTASVNMLTKADEGQVKQLRMLIPELKNLTDEQIKNGEAVDIVAAKTAGLADKIGAGTAGSLAKFSAAWDGLLETIGQNIAAAPWVEQLTKVLNDLAAATANATAVLETTKKVKSSDAAEGSFERLNLELERLKALKKYYNENIKDAFFLNKLTDEYGELVKTIKVDLTTDKGKKDAGEQLDRMITGLAMKVESLRPLPVKVEPVFTAKPSSKPTAAKPVDSVGKKLAEEWKDATMSFDIYREQVVEGYKKIGQEVDSESEAIDQAWKASVDSFNQTKELIVNGVNTIYGSVEGVFGAWMDLESQRSQAVLANYDRELKALEDRHNAEKKAKEDLGLSTAEIDQQYEAQKEQLEKERLAKENEFGKKAFEANKANTMAGIVMNTANAVVAALGMVPWTLANPIIASSVGALGAAQLGIASQMQYVPKFATGGIVPGSSFTGDNILTRLNSGEMVLNQTQQSRLFDMINGGRGGVNIQVNGVVGSPTDVAIAISKEIEKQKALGVI